MRFEGYKLSRLMMHNGWAIWILAMLGWFTLYPLAAGKGFMLFRFIEIAFFSYSKLTLWLLFLCFLSQLISYDLSRTKPKFLEVLEDKAVFHLLNGKIHEFKYSGLSSLDRTNKTNFYQ